MPRLCTDTFCLALSYGGALEVYLWQSQPAELLCWARQVETETSILRGNLRGFLACQMVSFMFRFQPNANVVPLTCNYFVKRMSTERFFIVDPAHHIVIYAPENEDLEHQLDDASLEELL